MIAEKDEDVIEMPLDEYVEMLNSKLEELMHAVATLQKVINYQAAQQRALNDLMIERINFNAGIPGSRMEH